MSDDVHDYGRLRAGLTDTGRGIDRRQISVVVTLEDRIVARLPYVRFGANSAATFIQGRERCHLWLRDHPPVHDNDLQVVRHEGGTPPFKSITHDIMAGGKSVYVAGREDEVQHFHAGWRHALKERGLISKKGRLKG